jgi:hypothetical protein
MKLYEISESVILRILTDMSLPQGRHEIIKQVRGFRYPLKIVLSVDKKILNIITSYPLKKGRQ